MHAHSQENEHTKKSQKRESEEKTPYWEVEFMFFWLMQNFFRASWKVCLIKKERNENKMRPPLLPAMG